MHSSELGMGSSSALEFGIISIWCYQHWIASKVLLLLHCKMYHTYARISRFHRATVSNMSQYIIGQFTKKERVYQLVDNRNARASLKVFSGISTLDQIVPPWRPLSFVSSHHDHESHYGCCWMGALLLLVVDCSRIVPCGGTR